MAENHPRLFVKCPICGAEIEIGQEGAVVQVKDDN